MQKRSNKNRRGVLIYDGLEKRLALNADMGGVWAQVLTQVSDDQFDDQGRLAYSKISYFSDANVLADPYRIDNQSWHYRDDGLVDAITTDSDLNADGSIDSRQLQTYQYNENSELLGILYENDNDGDGIYEDSHQETIFVPDPNILVDPIRQETNEVHDDQGRLIGSTTSFYLGDSVDPYSIETQTWSYLEDGRVNTLSTAYDSNADGVVDSLRMETYQYNETSELIGILYEYDNDGDGIYESSFDSGLGWGNGGYWCGTSCDGPSMWLGANWTPETVPNFPAASPISNTYEPIDMSPLRLVDHPSVVVMPPVVDHPSVIVTPEASDAVAPDVLVADISQLNLSAFVLAGSAFGVASATSDVADSNRDPLSLPIVRSLSLASAVVLADENSPSGLTFESSREKYFAVESSTEKLGSLNDDFFANVDALSSWE